MATPLNAVRHILLDMDGVVVRGRSALPGSAGFVRAARELGLAFAILTNNSTRTGEQYSTLLAAMDIAVEPHEVFTSSRATVAYLQSLEGGAGATVYAIGEDGLLGSLEAGGYRLTPDSPKYVIVGLDRQFSYEKLKIARRAIVGGATLIATNPDTTFPAETEVVPGCGSLVAAVEAASGVRAIVIGKPFPSMFASALADLGATRESTVVVGDRLDTDIQGGADAGLTTVLVLTGVTDEAMLKTSTVRPDYVYPSLKEFGEALRAAHG